MKTTLDIPMTELDKITKKILREDLTEYEDHILPDAKKDDKEDVKRIKKIIKAYKTILKENYKHVHDI